MRIGDAPRLPEEAGAAEDEGEEGAGRFAPAIRRQALPGRNSWRVSASARRRRQSSASARVAKKPRVFTTLLVPRHVSVTRKPASSGSPSTGLVSAPAVEHREAHLAGLGRVPEDLLVDDHQWTVFTFLLR